MRVIIRADGNREIAMGHCMRCLSIADAMRREAEILFVTAGGETRELIESRGFPCAVLGTDYRDMESELPAFWAVFASHPAALILTDSYFVTKRYLQELGKLAATAYLDDLGWPVYPLSILINYNIYAPRLPYERRYREAGLPLPDRILTGCAYAPLRAEFAALGERAAAHGSGKPVTDVLITTGGGDMAGAAESLCAELSGEIGRGEHRGVSYHVVCGPFAADTERLGELAAAYPQFVLHRNVTNMSELMSKCDIAVSAAGSTMYELCAMRVPTVCFYFAENQRQMAECFHQTTEIQCAGNLTRERGAVLDRLLRRLRELETDGALRERIRAQMARLTDGRGAVRLAGELLAYSGRSS